MAHCSDNVCAGFYDTDAHLDTHGPRYFQAALCARLSLQEPERAEVSNTSGVLR